MNAPPVDEIITAIRLLNVNKAVGPDGIPAFYLQSAATVIAPYLQCFVEFSFANGIFPENCAVARVFPLHKEMFPTQITIAPFPYSLVSRKF